MSPAMLAISWDINMLSSHPWWNWSSCPCGLSIGPLPALECCLPSQCPQGLKWPQTLWCLLPYSGKPVDSLQPPHNTSELLYCFTMMGWRILPRVSLFPRPFLSWISPNSHICCYQDVAQAGARRQDTELLDHITPLFKLLTLPRL